MREAYPTRWPGLEPNRFGFAYSEPATVLANMASTPDEHAHETPEPVTDRVHDTSWSANLEKPAHAADPQHVIDGAVTAIEHTEPGNHVNLVTHGDHGHPQDYLYDALAEVTWDRDLSWEYVEQCGCGGHVTRVHVE